MALADIPHLELGHALITMIEPDRATLDSYTEWYERDHFLAGVLVGPGAYAGQRFVATRELKDLRTPHTSPIARPVDDGSFITLYWMERGKLADHCDWGFPEAARFAAEGRMRTDRHHVSTSYYDVVGWTGRGERPVPIELALHHPYAAIVVAWTVGEGDDAASAAGVREALTTQDSPIGSVVSLRAATLPAPLPAMPGVVIGDAAFDQRSALAHCCFVDGAAGTDALADVTARVTEAIGDAGLTALLVAPFIPTVPGTTTHFDRLW